MKLATHICFEGTEGCFKTTNAKALSDYLRAEGNTVLETKEPGSAHLPLTMSLRAIMLDSKYEKEMTRQAREFISQAIRSIHVTHLLRPAMTEYDFIVQDRGMLSGIAYGVACGNSKKEIEQLLSFIYDGKVDEYDLIVFLQGDTEAGLKTAVSSKQEFEGGDAMEAKGLSFMKEVEAYFYQLLKTRKNVVVVNVVNKSREDILSEIIQAVHNLFK